MLKQVVIPDCHDRFTLIACGFIFLVDAVKFSQRHFDVTVQHIERKGLLGGADWPEEELLLQAWSLGDHVAPFPADSLGQREGLKVEVDKYGLKQLCRVKNCEGGTMVGG